jgi:hypothetical protein
VMPICIVLGFGVAYLANGTPSPDNGGLLEEFKMVVLQCRVVTARLSTIVHLVQMTTLLHTLIFVVLESAWWDPFHGNLSDRSEGAKVREFPGRLLSFMRYHPLKPEGRVRQAFSAYMRLWRKDKQKALQIVFDVPLRFHGHDGETGKEPEATWQVEARHDTRPFSA